MKLDSDNVLKALLDCIANPPDNPTGVDEPVGNRDGLPEINIEGVKCAVDIVNKVIQTGEGREQCWFEVALHDVTPKRFLSREEQLEMMAEVEDWWTVTGPTHIAFVRARSRSKAMQYFAAKYHEKPSDCELARGFEFVDPTKEELPVEEIVPDPNFVPMGGQAIPDHGPWAETAPPILEDGDESGDCDGLRPEEEDEPEKGDEAPPEEEKGELLKPEDLYFGAMNTLDGPCMVLCPKKFWNDHHHMYDGHLDVQHLLPPYFEGEDMECTWVLPDGKQTEEVAIDMATLGFERNLELEGLLEEVHES